MHITVLLQEAVDALGIKPSGIYVDGTFGYGGHSRLILEKLGKSGRLIAFDKDMSAVTKGQSIKEYKFSYYTQQIFSNKAGVTGIGCAAGRWSIAGFRGVITAT